MKIVSIFIPSLKEEIQYTIGENAKDNFDIIDSSQPDDIWFHLHGESSSHIVADIPNDLKLDKKQKRQVITQGAVLCKQHSKYKSLKDVNIIYTEIKNITKTETIGQVLVGTQKHINI